MDEQSQQFFGIVKVWTVFYLKLCLRVSLILLTKGEFIPRNAANSLRLLHFTASQEV